MLLKKLEEFNRQDPRYYNGYQSLNHILFFFCRFKKFCLLVSEIGHIFVKDVGMAYIVGKETIIPASHQMNGDLLSRMRPIYVADIGDLKCEKSCSPTVLEKYISLLKSYHGHNANGIFIVLGLIHLGMNRPLLGSQYNIPPAHVMGPGHSGKIILMGVQCPVIITRFSKI